jgi:hypothetical protein
LVLLVLATATCPADVLLSGRYENQAAVLWYRSGVALLDQNRLRVELDASPDPRVSFDAAVWVETYHGATVLDLTDQLPRGMADSLPDSLRQALTVRLEPGVRLDRAFVSVQTGRLRIKLGKQPLAWGTGYVWNPTEVIPAKSFVDPGYERDGETALRFELNLPGPRVQAMFLPGPDLGRSGMVLRLAGNIAGFDWGVTGTRRTTTAGLTGVERTATMAGGQFKGELFGPGVWAEGGYWWPDSGSGWYRACAGLDYTLGTRTYLLAEYFRNSPGLAGEYSLQDWLARAIGDRDWLGRDYLFVGLFQPLLGFHQVGLSALANLDDRSLVLVPVLSLGLSDNLDLRFTGLVPVGREDTEFGGPGTTGAVGRLTFYF